MQVNAFFFLRQQPMFEGHKRLFEGSKSRPENSEYEPVEVFRQERCRPRGETKNCFASTVLTSRFPPYLQLVWHNKTSQFVYEVVLQMPTYPP